MNGYVQLRRGLLDHLKIMRGSELKIYNALLILADFNTGKAKVSQTQLAEITGLSVRMTGTACSRLKVMGYLKIKSSKNQWEDNTYTITKYLSLDKKELKDATEKALEPILKREESNKNIDLIRLQIFERDNNVCQLCGRECLESKDLPKKRDGIKKYRELFRTLRTIDHIVPIVKGGSDDEFNLQTLCWSCNARKGSNDWVIAEPIAEPIAEAGTEPHTEAQASNQEKEASKNLEELKELKESTYTTIFDTWISANITNHKKLSADIKKAIDNVLAEYELEDILTAIENYGIVVNSDSYYFNHRWRLEEFLKGGGKDRIPNGNLKRFLSESNPLDNFKETKQKTKSIQNEKEYC